jgi:hypothetical protein
MKLKAFDDSSSTLTTTIRLMCTCSLTVSPWTLGSAWRQSSYSERSREITSKQLKNMRRALIEIHEELGAGGKGAQVSIACIEAE